MRTFHRFCFQQYRSTPFSPQNVERADAISLRIRVRRALRSGADYVICDRYAWDELANLTLQRWSTRSYVRLIARIAPRPDVSFLIDADPIQARARKPEYPLDFLYRCREAYLALSELVGGITVIAPGPVGEVHAEILRHAGLDRIPPARANAEAQQPGRGWVA